MTFKAASAKIIIFAACYGISPLAWGQPDGYKSARFLGRGDTAIAEAWGSDAMFYNPAGLAQKPSSEWVLLSPQVEASVNSFDLYKKSKDGETLLNTMLAEPQHPYYLAGQNFTGVTFRNWGVGAMTQGQATAVVHADENKASVDVWGVSRTGIYTTLAESFYKNKLFLGVTGKFVQKAESSITVDTSVSSSTLSDEELRSSFSDATRRGNAIGADVGLIALLDARSQTKIGAVYRDLGMAYQWSVPGDGQAPSRDTSTLDVGFTTSFGTKRSRIKLFADYRDVTDALKEKTYKDFHAGGEYNMIDTLAVMAGLYQGNPTYGLSLTFKMLRVEAGYYTEQVGPSYGDLRSDRYFGRISMGWFL